MDVIWIDEVEALRGFVDEISHEEAIAIDTESDHFHAYNARVCLIQVASPERAALVDPLALDAEDLDPLFDLLEDSSTVKILHSCRNDVREIDRDYGVAIHNVFDTQIAAKFIGHDRNALSWLLEELLGLKLGKQYQRFDWTRRPIPPEPREYAALDVIPLFDLRERFLDELGDWVEPFRETCTHYAATSGYEASEFDPEDWRRVKGAEKLDGRSRAVVRELFIVRHELLEDVNRAALHVFDNRALKNIAKERPTTRKDLGRTKGLAPALASYGGEKILAAIERGLSAEVPPKRRPRQRAPRMSDEARALYDDLNSWRNETAHASHLPSEFIATNSTLRKISLEPPRSLEELGRFEDILPWQRERFGSEILEIIDAH